MFGHQLRNEWKMTKRFFLQELISYVLEMENKLYGVLDTFASIKYLYQIFFW